MPITHNRIGLASHMLFDETGTNDVTLHDPQEVRARYLIPEEPTKPFIAVDGESCDEDNNRTYVGLFMTVEQARDLRDQLDQAIKDAG